MSPVAGGIRERSTLNAADKPDIPGDDGDGDTRDDAAHSQRQVGGSSAERECVLASLMDVPAAIAIVRGPRHVYEFANGAYRALTRERDPIGHAFGDSGANPTSPAMRAMLDGVYTAGEPYTNREMTMRLDRDGDGALQEAWFDVACHPIRNARDAIEGVFIHALEITSHVKARIAAEAQAEQFLRQRSALRETEERLRMVIASAPMLMIAVDAEARILFSDGLELARIGVRAGENVGKSFIDTHPQALQIHANIRRALAGESFSSVHEFRGQIFETRMRPMIDDSGKIAGAIGVATNVTQRVEAEAEREKLQAQMLQAQKLESLGVLAGGIAHDFNNLLTGILGNASVALLELDSSAPAREAIQDVLNAARRAAALARQLLTYSGKGHREVGAVDLPTQVREIAKLVEASVSKKVVLSVDVAEDVPAIDADTTQLQQIVMNLVLNAAESIGDGCGTVRVSTGVEDLDGHAAPDLLSADPIAPGRYVYVDVSDDGSGMDEATKVKIFDPFFTTKATGRGLGLAAVVGIMRAHAGAIRITSQLGAGSAFRAYFPASKRRASIAPDVEADMFHGSGVVLVIDDEPHVRTVARRMLEWFGFEVIEASGGRDGIEKYRERSADIALVLLDMMMPELDGEDVFRELRAIRPDARVLLSSGYTEEEARERFRSEGLAGVVEKPYTTAQLAARIAKALKTSKA